MQNSRHTADEKILSLLKTNDEQAMELVFEVYYKYLVVTAYNILNDDFKAKDLVQEVLFNFWLKKDTIKINTGLKSYLRRSVVNRSIDQIRQKKRIGTTEEITDYNQASQLASAQEQLEREDLNTFLLKTIQNLPERCRLIFSLSRFEDLSHKEIATRLDISIKTIENQMTKALKVIRAAVKDYKNLVNILCLWFLNL